VSHGATVSFRTQRTSTPKIDAVLRLAGREMADETASARDHLPVCRKVDESASWAVRLFVSENHDQEHRRSLCTNKRAYDRAQAASLAGQGHPGDHARTPAGE